MAARARTRPPARQRHQRATSNIFAMFDQSQIQEFKEAFNIIDHDRVCSKKTNDSFELMIFFLFLFVGWFYQQ